MFQLHCPPLLLTGLCCVVMPLHAVLRCAVLQQRGELSISSRRRGAVASAILNRSQDLFERRELDASLRSVPLFAEGSGLGFGLFLGQGSACLSGPIFKTCLSQVCTAAVFGGVQGLHRLLPGVGLWSSALSPACVASVPTPSNPEPCYHCPNPKTLQVCACGVSAEAQLWHGSLPGEVELRGGGAAG
jgi:hypothetical protein